ncbi:MAG: hypothetical protein AAFR61_20700 [Bacteroidota bacterium]
MRRFLFFASLIGLGLLSSCIRPRVEPLVDPVPELSFRLTASNTAEPFQSEVRAIGEPKIRESWYDHDTLYVQLIRELTLEVELANGDTVLWGIWISKKEQDLELLDLTNNPQSSTHNPWSYHNLDHEAQRFYQAFDEVRILLNDHVIFYSEQNERFNLSVLRQATVNGSLQNYIEMDFDGLAKGWYDPYGQHQTVYRLEEGHFRGVMK